jgi:hypothetical protein
MSSRLAARGAGQFLVALGQAVPEPLAAMPGATVSAAAAGVLAEDSRRYRSPVISIRFRDPGRALPTQRSSAPGQPLS